MWMIYVGRNLWIWPIHGSRCAIYGSLLRAGIHGSRKVVACATCGFCQILRILQIITLHIVNLSVSHGIFPNDMTLTKTVPIFKNGNTKLLNNYRPISILPAFSKILEKIVCNRLLHFLETKTILYKHQYGFRKNHNTIHTIIHLLKDIATANDKASKNFT